MINFIIFIKDTYLDFKDFDTPVKTYIDDQLAFFLQGSSAKIIKLFARKNKATLDDDYLKISSASNKEFFSINKVTNDFTSYTSFVAKTIIVLDSKVDIYQRNVFTILDLFGTIGGIFGLLTSACGFFVGLISTQIMLSSVFRRLYY